MTHNPSRLSQFWQELKRRRVGRVISVYAAAAFVTLEVFSIIVEPLRLPDWTLTLVIILLAFGFLIAAILAWIYDVSPEGGLEKTKPVEEMQKQELQPTTNNWKIATYLSLIVIAGLIILNIVTGSNRSEDREALEKSIAVLPFINDSPDEENMYFINGIMEEILNDLQKIEDLRVISRTSVEQFRESSRPTTLEIAEKLDVNYIVEGSGQKYGNTFRLRVQLLLAAGKERHIWAKSYEQELEDADDLFRIQSQISSSIADELHAVITPEVADRINKIPTENLVAYDYFLQGLELLNTGNNEKIEEALEYFGRAVEEDPEYARAYAAIAIAYYRLDEYQAEKQYSAQINHYADQALLYDSQLPQSLIAKGLYYMNNEEYELAESYFEKTLEYSPNNDLVLVFLVELYTSHLPDTEKYLEYTLKGIATDIASYDSTTASMIYLHLSNAFMQSGFISEAEGYIEQSLDYDPGNLYAEYVKAYILYAKDKDLHRIKTVLQETLNKDTTRIDILQETGKICYYLRDYEQAFHYYKRVTEIREAYNLDLFRSEDAKIGFVLSQLGKQEESDKMLGNYLEYAEDDESIYRDLNLAIYHAYKGHVEKAIEHLELFSAHTNYNYLIIPFLQVDPLVDNIRDHPEFAAILETMEVTFWERHGQIRAYLEEKGLL